MDLKNYLFSLGHPLAQIELAWRKWDEAEQRLRRLVIESFIERIGPPAFLNLFSSSNGYRIEHLQFDKLSYNLQRALILAIGVDGEDPDRPAGPPFYARDLAEIWATYVKANSEAPMHSNSPVGLALEGLKCKRAEARWNEADPAKKTTVLEQLLERSNEYDFLSLVGHLSLLDNTGMTCFALQKASLQDSLVRAIGADAPVEKLPAGAPGYVRELREAWDSIVGDRSSEGERKKELPLAMPKPIASYCKATVAKTLWSKLTQKEKLNLLLDMVKALDPQDPEVLSGWLSMIPKVALVDDIQAYPDLKKMLENCVVVQNTKCESVEDGLFCFDPWALSLPSGEDAPKTIDEFVDMVYGLTLWQLIALARSLRSGNNLWITAGDKAYIANALDGQLERLKDKELEDLDIEVKWAQEFAQEF